MSVADGGIVCDEATHDSSKDKIAYYSLSEKIRVKGFESEISVYTPLKSVESGNVLNGINQGWSSASFIGRAKEKTIVADLNQKLKAKNQQKQMTEEDNINRVVILEGEGS